MGKKILVAEDDKFLIKIYDSKLRKEGFEVILAYDGVEATKRILEKPDLVILDLIMPQKDGFDVLKEIKENKKTSHIPVIVLSNLGQEEDKARCLKLGAKEFLVKSDTPIGDVVKKVKALLA